MAEQPTGKLRPNVRQRWVARKIVQWREAHDPPLNQAELAKLCDWSPSKLNRFEKCTAIIPPLDVVGIAAILHVDEAERKRVYAYARAGLEGDVWWQAFGAEAVPEYAHDYLETEAFAARIRTFEHIVPGLLQDPSYADALFRISMPRPDESVIQRRRELRLQRQKRLENPDNLLELHAIVPEHAVLRQLVGSPAVMVKQLDMLIARAQQANVVVRVLPRERGAYPGLGSSYHLLSFEDEETEDTEALYLENSNTGMFVEEQKVVQQYSLNYERLIQPGDPALASGDASCWTLEPDASLERMVDIREEWARM